jgi:hypothetical protein
MKWTVAVLAALTPSRAARLAWIKVLVALPLLLVWHLHPRDLRTAVAAIVGAAVLVGAPGYRDNLEIPLAYTAVGMLLGRPRCCRSHLVRRKTSSRIHPRMRFPAVTLTPRMNTFAKGGILTNSSRPATRR